jgi:hypothetical protein
LIATRSRNAIALRSHCYLVVSLPEPELPVPELFDPEPCEPLPLVSLLLPLPLPLCRRWWRPRV